MRDGDSAIFYCLHEACGGTRGILLVGWSVHGIADRRAGLVSVTIPPRFASSVNWMNVPSVFANDPPHLPLRPALKTRH